MTDWSAVRAEFPALETREGVAPPAYLDSACMSLVPRAVLAAMEEYYREYPGCAGRSLHRFAEEVGQRYESARATFARFLGVAEPSGVVFLRNATEAINLVGQGIDWRRGDRVVITDQEHNSNLVLWQRLARERGIRVDVLELPDGGGFDPKALERILARPVRLVSLFQTSNLDGRSLPIRAIADATHDAGGELLVDGCQAAPHGRVDLARLGADYYALSLHKMLGPSGTGLLASSPERLARLRPLIVGGETVEWTTLTDHALRPPPHRFEAGLQNYAGVLGATAAVEMLERVGLDSVQAHDADLNARATAGLAAEPRVRILGPASPKDRPSILAFTIEGIDPHDAALFLDAGHGVLVRSGRHCVHSWYERRGLVGNVRASFYLYNTDEDVAALVAGVRELVARMPSPPPRATERPASGTSGSKRRAGAPRDPSRRRGAGS